MGEIMAPNDHPFKDWKKRNESEQRIDEWLRKWHPTISNAATVLIGVVLVVFTIVVINNISAVWDSILGK